MRSRKSGGLPPEIVVLDSMAPAAEVPAFSPGLLARTEDLRLEVLVELSRMAQDVGGGSCVLFRKAPQVAPDVEAEIRRLCLAEPGSKIAAALPVFCFDRPATDVLSEIVRGLAKGGGQ
jgi:hypothetical protein